MAGLRVSESAAQTDFPEGMFAVQMYALEPAGHDEAGQPQRLGEDATLSVQASAAEPEQCPQPSQPEPEPEERKAGEIAEHLQHSIRTRKVQPQIADEARATTSTEEESMVWADWDPVHVHTGEEVMARLRAYATACRAASIASGSYARQDGRVVIGTTCLVYGGEKCDWFPLGTLGSYCDLPFGWSAGMVGCPNVGKSTTVNALSGGKDVAVSETPVRFLAQHRRCR